MRYIAKNRNYDRDTKLAKFQLFSETKIVHIFKNKSRRDTKVIAFTSGCKLWTGTKKLESNLLEIAS